VHEPPGITIRVECGVKLGMELECHECSLVRDFFSLSAILHTSCACAAGEILDTDIVFEKCLVDSSGKPSTGR